ncbi:hypothetical protein D3C73_714910 [compost metagenome]
MTDRASLLEPGLVRGTEGRRRGHQRQAQGKQRRRTPRDDELAFVDQARFQVTDPEADFSLETGQAFEPFQVQAQGQLIGLDAGGINVLPGNQALVDQCGVRSINLHCGSETQ